MGHVSISSGTDSEFSLAPAEGVLRGRKPTSGRTRRGQESRSRYMDVEMKNVPPAVHVA